MKTKKSALANTVLSLILSIPLLIAADPVEGAFNHLSDDEDIRISSNIQYGKSTTYAGDTVNLKLDMYKPVKGEFGKRPLVVFLHGGGFHDGEKDDEKIVSICSSFAVMGYTAVSIEYRTGIPRKTKKYFCAALLRAVKDTREAIHFLKCKSRTYGIDTNNIYLGGLSAGAVVALHAGFWDTPEIFSYIGMHRVELPGFDITELRKMPKIHGIINCWGAILNPKWIENNNIPILNIHGTRDRLAPYKKGRPMHIFWLPKIYGSYYIHHHALGANHQSILKSYYGMKHGHNEKSIYMDTTLTLMHTFINCLLDKQKSNLSILWEKNQSHLFAYAKTYKRNRR